MLKNKWIVLFAFLTLSIGCDTVHVSAEASKRFKYHEGIRSLALAFSKETWTGDQSSKKNRTIELLVLNLKPDIRENLQIRFYKNHSNEFETGELPLIILTKRWQSLSDQTGIDYDGDLIPATGIELEQYEIINPFETR